jgi:hypothetical protein
MPGLEGTALSHYRLQRRLGRGGMSEVYLATDETTQQDVAIKLVSSSHEEYTERFLHEIETMHTLTHKHILPVLDSGEHGPWRYLVMPYIRQGTLHGRLRRGRLTFQEASEILEQVVSALQYAHDQGIIHRDIKPSNILLDCSPPIYRGGVYLADFGLAKAVEDDYGITQTNCLMGTPEYLAPELMDGAATIKSDIYALGILLYEMVTGRVPFKASTPVGVCWKHLHEQPTPPSQLNPAINQATEQAILCALEKDPCHRFESAKALLDAYQESLAISTDTSKGGDLIGAAQSLLHRDLTERSAKGKDEEVCVLAQSATFPAIKIWKLAGVQGGGKPRPYPTMKRMAKPSRVGAGLAPALMSARDWWSNRSSRAHSILVAFTVFIFLLTTSLSLGLYVASNGLRTYYSTYVASTTPLIDRGRTQQKVITPTFNVALHRLEENLVTSPTLGNLPPAKNRPHNSGNTVDGIGKGPSTIKFLVRPESTNPIPEIPKGNDNGNGNGNGNHDGHGNHNDHGHHNGDDNGNGNGNHNGND